MIKLPVEQAVGQVLAHDMTRIVPGEFKGPAFKKGHIVRNEDIELLKSMGKHHVYIFELDETRYHEDEAAGLIASLAAGENLEWSQPSEGKVNLKATCKGLLQVNREVLEQVNESPEAILSTLHTHSLVEAGQVVAGTRIIPLTLEKEKVEAVLGVLRASGPILSVRGLQPLRTGIVVTGTEVYSGTIQDRFGPVLAGKVNALGAELMGIRYAPDDPERISEEIRKLLDEGAGVVMVSGGMSVDPDDVTPIAIRNTADRVVTYGAPVLPGAMFMMAYRGEAAIIGVPGCGMYSRVTILDLIYPRILAGIEITRKDIVRMGHGGLCLGCGTCHYPICPFGKA